MKKILFALLIISGFSTAAQHKISIDDFRMLEGKWKGTLTYLDYKSNTETTMQANTMVEIINDTEFNQYVYYSGEPDKNGMTRYGIKENGTMLNDRKLIERTKQPDGSLKLVFESKGPDGNDNKPATFNHILFISSAIFTVTKMVKFDDGKDFFRRHIYAFSR